MEHTTTEKIFTLNVKTFTSITGEKFTLNDDDIIKMIHKSITDMESSLERQCKIQDNIAEFNSTENKLPTQIASNTFFRDFYIKYVGNPSLNGGVFQYDRYNVNFETKHLFHDNKIDTNNGYMYYIALGLACSKSFRTWGYGINQLGGKYILEEPEAAKEFVDFMINRSYIDLNDINPNATKDKTTIGEGLFWYCIRSMYFDRLDELIKYVYYLEDIPKQLEDVYDDLKNGASNNAMKNINKYESWLKKTLEKIIGLQNSINIHESNFFTDARDLLKKIYKSPSNEKYNFMIKNKGNDDEPYSIDPSVIANLN